MYEQYRHVRLQRVRFFLAVLVINTVSILAILAINRVWLLPSSLDVGMFLERSYVFTIIDKTINKSLSQIMFNIGLNWGTDYKAGLKPGIDLRLR